MNARIMPPPETQVTPVQNRIRMGRSKEVLEEVIGIVPSQLPATGSASCRHAEPKTGTDIVAYKTAAGTTPNT
jgi:hypothetical protein